MARKSCVRACIVAIPIFLTVALFVKVSRVTDIVSHYSSVLTACMPQPSCYKHTVPTNIVFIKVHKAGSTTVSNMLARYALTHNLNIALPEQEPKGDVFHCFGPFEERRVLPLAAGQQYHVLFNHMIYNRTALDRVMPKNTMYVAIMREPLKRLLSGVYYFKLLAPPAKNNTDNGAFKTFFSLKNRQKMELNFRIFNSVLWNTGLPLTQQHDITAVKRHLDILDKELNLMLVMEHFFESLILLKRRAFLTLTDIIFIKTNSRKNKNIHQITEEDRTMLRSWQKGDHLVYDHFYVKFCEEILKEGPAFQDEVAHFKDVNLKVNEYCAGNASKVDTLVVPYSKWNQEFTISDKDCQLMNSDERDLQKMLLGRAKMKRRQAGYEDKRGKRPAWNPNC